jgi:hypothetical protein
VEWKLGICSRFRPRLAYIRLGFARIAHRIFPLRRLAKLLGDLRETEWDEYKPGEAFVPAASSIHPPKTSRNARLSPYLKNDEHSQSRKLKNLGTLPSLQNESFAEQKA